MIDLKPTTTLLSIQAMLEFDRDHVGISDEVATAYHHHILDRYQYFKTSIRTQSPEAFNDFIVLESRVPFTGFRSLLKAPRAINLLKKVTEANVLQVAKIFGQFQRAEIARAEQKFDPNHASALWSAKGDYLIRYNATTQAFAEYNFETLPNGILIDCFSPAAELIRNMNGQELQPFSVEAYAGIVQHIKDCVSPIHNAGAFAIVDRFVEAIVVRQIKDGAAGKAYFSSGTISDLLRQINLITFDLKAVPKEEITDSLIHEAIHSLLGILDDLNHWMPDEKEFPGVMSRAVSPWSGNTVLLQAMLHAIFIWYGLFFFWHNAKKLDAYDNTFADKQIGIIVKGFRLFEPEKYFRAHDVYLEDYLVEIYSGMRRKILSMA